jgi:hypothetical protein
LLQSEGRVHHGLMDYWAVWFDRLRRADGIIFDLPRETDCLRLDDQGRWTQGRVVIPGGTNIRYVKSTYDAMRLDECLHIVTVVSGPSAGMWVGLMDVVGPGPLPWERWRAPT